MIEQLPRPDFRCATCGYGVARRRPPERCPMCTGSRWEKRRPQTAAATWMRAWPAPSAREA